MYCIPFNGINNSDERFDMKVEALELNDKSLVMDNNFSISDD
jgi:hypothetical protein